MSTPFRVGLTRDLLDAAGAPSFGRAALDVLGDNPAIAWEFLPEPLTEITPDVAACYDGLYVNVPRVTAASVARADLRLKIVARHGVGYDSVDVAALAARGVLVTNTPLAVRRPVAVATLTMIFALTGRLITKDRLVRENRWAERTSHMGLGLTRRTLGIVGAGGIGRELLALARPFFGRMLAADPHADAAEIGALGARLDALDAVAAASDVLVVCCLLNAATHHLIDARRLRLMKPDAFLINVARGPVVDEAALIAALADGTIQGAGLDVFEHEPVRPDNPLLAVPNVLLAPHALAWTDEAFHDIAATGLRSIVDVSLGRRPVHVVPP
jgi:phosphoglycerate dehydrogenase-like enzyme